MTNIATCGHCGRQWDDSISTSWTPVPSGRCPFEYHHVYNKGDVAEPLPEELAAIVIQPERSRVLLIDHDAGNYDPAVPFGPFTRDEAILFAEDFREENGLPREATPENNETWTDLDWYFGIFELRTEVERWGA